MHKDAQQTKSGTKKKSGKAGNSTKVEGEGSYEAGRRYDAGVREFADSGAVNVSAKEAERAVESDEGQQLREAEKVGKHGVPAKSGDTR